MTTSFPTRAMTYAIGALGTLRVPGVFSVSCRDGACCARTRVAVMQPVSPAVRALAFYSRDDGIVSWQACLPEGARHIEVPGTHLGDGREPSRLAADVRVAGGPVTSVQIPGPWR
jgi:hypothetical protein